jgi:hypothetical protein
MHLCFTHAVAQEHACLSSREYLWGMGKVATPGHAHPKRQFTSEVA